MTIFSKDIHGNESDFEEWCKTVHHLDIIRDDEQFPTIEMRISTKIHEMNEKFVLETIMPFVKDRIRMEIDKQELVDALTHWRNLVRCKDCKNGFSVHGVLYCKMPTSAIRPVRLDHFCSYGERKNRNNDRD